MPTISIIIPVYNAELYLRQCIESVIAQTFEDWEAILVNDGSKDGSLDICQEYAAKDERIKVIDKPNGGVSSARNKGLEVAQGDWITFMDSDDWLDADAFEVYYEAAQRTGADIVKTGYRRVCNNGNDNDNGNACKGDLKALNEVTPVGNSKGLGSIKRGSEANEASAKTKDLLNEEFAWQEMTLADKSDALARLQETGYFTFVCNMIVTSQIAKEVRFDESTPWLEDQFYGYECLLRADKITLLPKMVYNYRIHESGSLSGVCNPFVIAYSARKDIEYKLRIFGGRHQEIVEKCWMTYHQWQAQAIDYLNKNYSYADRRRFLDEFSPIDKKCVYAEERKFFDGINPFWLNDAVERLKRFIKR